MANVIQNNYIIANLSKESIELLRYVAKDISDDTGNFELDSYSRHLIREELNLSDSKLTRLINELCNTSFITKISLRKKYKFNDQFYIIFKSS